MIDDSYTFPDWIVSCIVGFHGLVSMFITMGEEGPGFSVCYWISVIDKAGGIAYLSCADSTQQNLLSAYRAWLSSGSLSFEDPQPSEPELERCIDLSLTLIAWAPISLPASVDERISIRTQYRQAVDALEAFFLDEVDGVDPALPIAQVSYCVHRFANLNPPMTFPADTHRYCWDSNVFPPNDEKRRWYWVCEDEQSWAPIRIGGLTGHPFLGGGYCVAKMESETLTTVGWPCRLYRVFAVDYVGLGGAERYAFTRLDGGTTAGIRSNEEFGPSANCLDSFIIEEEIEPWRAFGPNGRQVVAAVEWWRGIAPRGRSEEKSRELRNHVLAAYRRRVDLRWRTQYPDSPATDSGFRASSSLRFWLPHRALIEAWIAVSALAISSKRFWAASYVAECPGFVALVFRDILPPKHFRALYAPLEDFLPLLTLDADVEPIRYRA